MADFIAPDLWSPNSPDINPVDLGSVTEADQQPV